MSETKNILKDVLPSQMSLLQMKSRLNSAKNGHNLLKRKSEALNKKFRTIMMDIKEQKEDMVSLFRKSFFSLTEARYSASDNLSLAVIESVKLAATRVKIESENIVGVKFPMFTHHNEEEEENGSMIPQTTQSKKRKINPPIVSRGGEQIIQCKAMFGETIQRMIRLATLQSSFIALDRAIKSTNRRVNALEKIIQPRLQNTISFIREELDQLDIEETYRLRKIRDKKIKDLKKKQKLAQELRLAKIQQSALSM